MHLSAADAATACIESLYSQNVLEMASPTVRGWV